jgi:hypothetical protein
MRRGACDVRARDLTVAGDAWMVAMAELVVAVGKSAEPVAAALVAFEMSVDADRDAKERDLAEIRAKPRPEIVGATADEFSMAADALTEGMP